MTVRDAHLHYGDPAAMRRIAETSPLAETFPCYRTVQYGPMADYDSLFAAHGVEESVLVPSVFREHDKGEESLRCIAFAQTRPGLYPFALLDEEDTGFVDRHWRDIAGVKEHIVLHKSELTPAKREIFSQMQERGLTLLLHSQAACRAQYVADIARQFPRLKIQIAHLGRSTPDNLGFMEEMFRAFAPLQTVSFDTSTVRIPAAVERAVDIVGAGRILYGSDFPFFMDGEGKEDIMQAQIDHVLRARLSDGQRERIFSQNFKDWITKGA